MGCKGDELKGHAHPQNPEEKPYVTDHLNLHIHGIYMICLYTYIRVYRLFLDDSHGVKIKQTGQRTRYLRCCHIETTK